ncbi:MAG TPA: hypothetical protein VFF91_02380 [Pseudoxanthomonas sp.]|nr:hypothetical protein [Pseudoxanthomonas sp.]
MKRVLVVVAMGLASGCATEDLYLADRPPVRYPLDYPVCGPSGESGGMIYAPLRIRLVHAGFPDPDRLMALRQKDPNDDGCKLPRLYPGPSITERDTQDVNRSSAAAGLDKSGRGFFRDTAYRWELFNEEEMQKESERRATIEGYRAQNAIKFGHAGSDVIEALPETNINGRQWQHRIVKSYMTPAGQAPGSGELTSWREQYDYWVDETHFIRYTGYYTAAVVADPEWLAARRRLLRQLVEQLQIHPVTQEEIDAAWAEDARRRALEAECWSDRKCRRRGQGK